MIRLLLIALVGCAPRVTPSPEPAASHEVKSGAPVALQSPKVAAVGKNTLTVTLLAPVDEVQLIASLGSDELTRQRYPGPHAAGDTLTLEVDVPKLGRSAVMGIAARCATGTDRQSRMLALDIEGIRVEQARSAPVQTDPYGRPIRPAQ